MAGRKRIRVQNLAQEVKAIFDVGVRSEERQRLFAQFARDELLRAQKQNESVLGFVPNHVSTVDGQKTENYDRVRPDGIIRIEFELLQGVFEWFRQALMKESPVGSPTDKRPGHPGLYRESHVLTADQDYVPWGEPVPMAKEYAILSVVPYARKIERGLSPQARGGVYQSVAALAGNRWSNIARIWFNYRDPHFGAIDEWARRTNLPSRASGTKRDDWLRRQPAIVIRPR